MSNELFEEVDKFTMAYIENHHANVENPSLPEANRGSWFTPTVSYKQAKKVKEFAEENNIDTIIDLGAGDLRLSIYLARNGFNVVAYETLEIGQEVQKEFEIPNNLTIKQEDYYEYFDSHDSDNNLFCCFGKSNKLPKKPHYAYAITGYEEINIITPQG